MDRMVRSLQIMQSAVEEPSATDIGEYVEKYEEVQKIMRNRHVVGSLLQKIELYEREVVRKFSPANIELTAGASTAPKESKGGDGQTADGGDDDLPPPPGETPPPPTETREEKTEPVDTSSTPFWMLYKSWTQVHGELTKAFREGKDCSKHYRRAVDLVERMSAVVKEKERNTLNLCVKIYRDTNEETGGFKTLPEGVKSEDILNKLEMIARAISHDLDPDR